MKVQGRDVNHDNCPTVEASCWVGDFWNIWIFRKLLERPHRFGDLEQSIPEINRSTLSRKLQAMTEAGLVERTVEATSPPSVTYALTTNGKHIKPVIDALETFGQKSLNMPACDAP